MANKIMIDTNIFLYAYDQSEPEKQPRALRVLDRLAMLGLGVTTPQVLGEFFVNSVRKLKPPLTVQEACERIENHLSTWEVSADSQALAWNRGFLARS